MTGELVAKMRRWRDDPVAFCDDVLGVSLDAWQVEVLRQVAKNPLIAMKACKGPGKSGVLAMIGWWFLATRPHPKVVATSITGDNLRDGLWTEFSKWQKRSPLLSAMFEWSSSRIVCKESPETWFASARTWPKDADKTQQAASLAGIHGDYVLFLLDEVSDYPEGVVAAAEAALSTGIECKLVVAGNPTRTDGPLYRICTKDRARWYVKEISGDPDAPDRAPRINIEWARQQIATWGRDSNYVRVNVFGQFPLGGNDALIQADIVSQAMERIVMQSQFIDSPKVLGVDVARFGDDRTVIFCRQGVVAYRPRIFREQKIDETAGQVLRAINDQKPDAVFIDETGLGVGVLDLVNAHNYPAVGVNFGGKALKSGSYVNRRAEMWGEMAAWMKHGCLPDLGELAAELTGPSYWFNSSGQMVLESKDEMKARGLASPDLADALALTFAAPVAKAPAWTGMPGTEHRARMVSEYDPFAGGAHG